MSCSWIGRVNIIRRSILPQGICGFIAIPIEIPKAERKNKYSKNLYGAKQRKHANASTNWKNKNKAGGDTLPDFKLALKAVVIHTAWSWRGYRHTDQRNRIPNPHLYAQLVFDEERKSIRSDRTVSFTNGVGFP